MLCVVVSCCVLCVVVLFVLLCCAGAIYRKQFEKGLSILKKPFCDILKSFVVIFAGYISTTTFLLLLLLLPFFWFCLVVVVVVHEQLEQDVQTFPGPSNGHETLK